MAGRIFTRVVGIVYILLGSCAFVPVLSGAPTAETPANTHVFFHYEALFNQFPMNYLLAVLFIAVGVIGLWASLSWTTARTFDRGLFVGSMAAMVIGLCPQPFSSLFGLVPLHSWTVGLFLVTALCTFYGAFFDGPMPESATQPVFNQPAIKH